MAIPKKQIKPSVNPASKVTTSQYIASANMTNEEKKWREELRAFLRDNLLKKILPSQDARVQMTGDKQMDVWTVAFTHESFDPNIGRNYEELELLGDRVMDVNWIKYMMQKYPKITKSKLSELRTHYLSKVFQAKVAKQLGLDKWVRSGVPNSTHIIEDLLESFFGALDKVGDMTFKFGVGNGLAYNMVLQIFKDVQIDFSLAKGRPKTKIKEMFEKLGWKNAVENFREGENRTVIGTISLPAAGIQMLRSLNIPISSPVLAVETGNTKKIASDAAYATALQNIRRLGITDEWVLKYQTNRDYNNPDLIPYIQAIQNKLKREGFETFYFYKAQTGREGKYLQLIGVRPDGELKILSTNPSALDDIIEAKQTVLQIYARE